MVEQEERKLTGQLMERFKLLPRSFVVERHEQKITHGTPDICITGNWVTSRWEVKHATPNFKTKGIQELTMNRIALAGYAQYVVYWQKPNLGKRTYIVHPRDIGKDPESEWKDFIEGFDHDFVLNRVKDVHFNAEVYK